MIQISFLALGSSTIWVYRGGRHAAPVSRSIFPSPSLKPVPTLGQTLAPHPKRSNKSTWTTVSWSSKASSDTKEKLLWLVIVMIEKWFYQHFLSFFQAYSLIHREPTLTFTVDKRTWRKIFSKFLRKSLINFLRQEHKNFNRNYRNDTVQTS